MYYNYINNNDTTINCCRILCANNVFAVRWNFAFYAYNAVYANKRDIIISKPFNRSNANRAPNRRYNL